MKALSILQKTAVIATGLAVCAPAMAVKYGELDGNGHPHVGLMVALDSDGNPLWRCSGTMVTPTIYLTAGHCTYGAARVTIWFDADVDAGRPGNGYPFAGQVFGLRTHTRSSTIPPSSFTTSEWSFSTHPGIREEPTAHCRN